MVFIIIRKLGNLLFEQQLKTWGKENETLYLPKANAQN